MSMDTQNSKENIFFDQSNIAKSAAWAWFHHGSESKNERAARESNFWRPKIEPKPSRYKLEALKNLKRPDHSSSSKPPDTSLSSSRSHGSCQKSLLDKYEIEWISRQLEYYVALSRTERQTQNSDHEFRERNNNKLVGQKKKKKKKSDYAKGFESRHVAPCGSSREDVPGHRRLAGKPRVVVVGVSGCRPRPWGSWV